MNGLVPQTATLAPTTTASDPTSRCTTTQRWSAGSVTLNHTYQQTETEAKISKKKLLSPWLRGIWLAAPLDESRLSPPLPSLYQLCLCIPFSAHLFSPKQPYVYSGSLELAVRRVFCLAVGLISAAYLGPGRLYTHARRHTNTTIRTRPPETAGCIGCVWRHLEEAKHKKERCLSLLPCSPRHASAAPHNSSLCSALPGLPKRD